MIIGLFNGSLINQKHHINRSFQWKPNYSEPSNIQILIKGYQLYYYFILNEYCFLRIR